jgi:tRNA modification GTPase
MLDGDTIHAVATASGRAGVAVIRISGPAAFAVAERLAVPVRQARRMVLRKLRDAEGRLLDEGLLVRFDAGSSFTGEDSVELHVHGGRAVVSALLTAIDGTKLSRMARPGEFTRRALMNQRLDLTQVQGLGDLIDADCEMQRRAAIEVFGGGLAAFVETCRRLLIEALSFLEATIDFADEDVPVDVSDDVLSRLHDVRALIQGQLDGVSVARRLRSGFEVALIGAPNSGKSSLLNAMARSDVAIVSDIPGTTRDVVELRLDLKGLSVTVLDTAGLRRSDDAIEVIGIERALTRAARADVVIRLVDGSDPCGFETEVRTDLCVRTKTDLRGGWGISSISMVGIDELIDLIAERLMALVPKAGFVTELRDEQTLAGAAADLDEVIATFRQAEAEVTAERLRLIAERLSDVIGGIGIEDVLDTIFRSFCLGK